MQSKKNQGKNYNRSEIMRDLITFDFNFLIIHKTRSLFSHSS